jgi:predicted Holliday junction resolvase-like endonuclease
MKSDITNFFTLQRQIFGICPNPDCHAFFRLSDCRIFLRKKPVLDWMERIDEEKDRLGKVESKIDEKEDELRSKAREKGYKLAQLTVKKLDPVFTPRKLNPDDAKVIFHPIDYIVFNGMKGDKPIKNIVLLDRKVKETSQKAIQKSIEQVIQRENYEWQTLRVQEDGNIKVE